MIHFVTLWKNNKNTERDRRTARNVGECRKSTEESCRLLCNSQKRRRPPRKVGETPKELGETPWIRGQPILAFLCMCSFPFFFCFGSFLLFFVVSFLTTLYITLLWIYSNPTFKLICHITFLPIQHSTDGVEIRKIEVQKIRREDSGADRAVKEIPPTYCCPISSSLRGNFSTYQPHNFSTAQPIYLSSTLDGVEHIGR